VVAAQLRSVGLAAFASFALKGPSACTRDCLRYFKDEAKRLEEVADLLRKQEEEAGSVSGAGTWAGEEGVSPLGCPHPGCDHKETFGEGCSKAKAFLELAHHHLQDHVLDELDVLAILTKIAGSMKHEQTEQ
jgi:hypothetical protein